MPVLVEIIITYCFLGELNIKRTLLTTILREMKVKSYKTPTCQYLPINAPLIRVLCAKQLLEIIEEDPTFHLRTWFSDESHFDVDGNVNRQNHR